MAEDLKEENKKLTAALKDHYNYLNDINTAMWESFMIKDGAFTTIDGIRVMDILIKWAEKY